MIRLKYLFFFFLLLFFSPAVRGQEGNYRLLGEGNKDAVKLIWFVKNWPAQLQGFQVKRRTVNGSVKSDWTRIHPGTIVPGISRKKDFSDADKDVVQQRRLFKKLDSLLVAGKTKEIPTEEYIRKISSDTAALRAISIPFAMDYDLALINGFGYADRSVPPADGLYEYGLFPVINGISASNPADTYRWKHGTPPDLSLDFTVSAVPARKQRQVEVKWKVSVSKFKAKELNGFNVYRKDENGNSRKLNSVPVWFTPRKDSAEVSFYDIVATPDKKYFYAVAPVSLFGTEGRRVSGEFDPALYSKTASLPALKHLSSGTADQSVQLGWDFPKGEETLIKYFVLERADLPSGYSVVSAPLPPSSRNYSDTRAKKLRSYYRYRIRVVRENFPDMYSHELLVYYEPEIKPPAPKNLRVSLVKEGEKKFALLTWDKKAADDSITAGYRIYANFPPSDKILFESSIPQISENSYRYELFNFESANYLFRVSAVSTLKHESELSDTAVLNSPSGFLPNVNIWPFRVDSNTVTLQWTYPAISDLKGFRVYVDGKLQADENAIGKNSKEWKSGKLEYGKSYTFELQAISASGVLSRKSIPRVILIEKK